MKTGVWVCGLDSESTRDPYMNANMQRINTYFFVPFQSKRGQVEWSEARALSVEDQSAFSSQREKQGHTHVIGKETARSPQIGSNLAESFAVSYPPVQFGCCVYFQSSRDTAHSQPGTSLM